MTASAADRLTIVNGTVFTGDEFVTDCVVRVVDGVVDHVGRTSDEAGGGGEILDVSGATVVPGFVDIQVNGGAGVLFNDSTDVDALETLSRAHRRFGTTSLFPTYMTGPAAGMRAAARAVDDVRRAGNDLVAGIHFEGPVLNPEQVGAHDPSWITTYDDEVFAATLAADAPTIVTLAPECAGPEMVSRLVAAGATVAAGHTQASYEQMKAAAAAGVTGGTHLWNAMRPITSRDPGTVGALLGRNGLWCSIIADGRHVADETLRVSLACRDVDRTLLITDAMPPAAGGPPHFKLGPHDVRVEDGRCVMDNGTLAGAAVEMITCVRHCVERVGVELHDVLRMASLVPARSVGLESELGRIAPGRTARIAILDGDLHVTATVVGRSVETYDNDN